MCVVQEAIFIHDSILRALMPLHCGVEVMTEGDAFIIAFHDPHDALLYCLHAQARPRPGRTLHFAVLNSPPHMWLLYRLHAQAHPCLMLCGDSQIVTHKS